MPSSSKKRDKEPPENGLFGERVYAVDAHATPALGYVVEEEALAALRTGRLRDILSDRQGTDEAQNVFDGLALTDFGSKALADAL